MTEHELFFRARDAYIRKSPFFFQFDRVVKRSVVRKNSFFHTDDEYHWKLETFGRVQRHQRDVIIRIQLIGVGNECHLLQKLINLSKFGSNTNQFVDVLFAPSRLHRIFGLQFTHVSASIQRMAQNGTWAFR